MVRTSVRMDQVGDMMYLRRRPAGQAPPYVINALEFFKFKNYIPFESELVYAYLERILDAVQPKGGNPYRRREQKREKNYVKKKMRLLYKFYGVIVHYPVTP